MAPTPSSFGAIAGENGSDWLDNLEAHFLDQEWDDDNAKKCKYFRLKLTGCAKAQYEKFDDDTKNCWHKLSEKWRELHPSLVVVDTPEMVWICLFSSLRMDESRLVCSRTLPNGEETWECIEFAKQLEEVGNMITVNMSLSKGLEAYGNLPMIVRTHLPQFTDGPTLFTLCSSLCAVDHYFLADAARERSTLMNHLDKLDRLSQTYNMPYPCPFPEPARNFAPTQYNATVPFWSNSTSHLSSDVSLAAHRRYIDAVNTWHAKYGQDATPEPGMDKYLTTPGSVSPGSGKCWRCGQKGHCRRSPDCQQFPALPEMEQRYRATVQANIAQAIDNAVQFGADKLCQVAVNLIEANKWETFIQDYVELPNQLMGTIFDSGDLDSGNLQGDGV